MKREDDDGDSTDPFIVPLNGMAVDLIKSAQGRDNRRVLGAALIKPRPIRAPCESTNRRR